MSSTTNDGTHEATALAYVEDAKELNLPTGAHAEAAMKPRQPVGVYGAGKYGECRSLTLEEQVAEADKAALGAREDGGLTMPRNGSGVMSIPNTFVDQTPITAGAHNTNWSDAASEISNSVALDGQSQMSGPLKIASGTVAAPGLVPGSDLDTGLYRIGGDNLGVACAGAKVLDISTTGLDVTGALSAG